MISIQEAQTLVKSELDTFPAGPDELDINITVKDTPAARGFVVIGKRSSAGTTVTATPNPVKKVFPAAVPATVAPPV